MFTLFHERGMAWNSYGTMVMFLSFHFCWNPVKLDQYGSASKYWYIQAEKLKRHRFSSFSTESPQTMLHRFLLTDMLKKRQWPKVQYQEMKCQMKLSTSIVGDRPKPTVEPINSVGQHPRGGQWGFIASLQVLNNIACVVTSNMFD